MFDSEIFRDQYGTDAMRAVFSDSSLMSKWAMVEAALAVAEAKVGLVPTTAAAEIVDASRRAAEMDVTRIRELVSTTGHPLMPFLICFSELLSEEATRYLHWGATTQDIMDTATILQMKDAIGIVNQQMDEFIGVLLSLAERYRDSPVAGRTHGQHAVPITYGLKVVGLAAEMVRHRQRFDQVSGRVLTGQLGGAAGSLVSLGGRALDVRRLFCNELGLGEPVTSWHSARDGLAEYVCLVSLATMTLGRAALEVVESQRTEIDELAEPRTKASIGSSTMPQKENPMTSETVVGLARLQKSQPSRILDGMIQMHERDMSSWQAEWSAVGESSVTLSAALHHITDVYRGLRVRTSQMLQNLTITQGRITAEATMYSLAPTFGRPEAYDIVKAASEASQLLGTRFQDQLMSDERISAVLAIDLASAASIDASAQHASLMVGDAIDRLRDSYTPPAPR